MVETIFKTIKSLKKINKIKSISLKFKLYTIRNKSGMNIFFLKENDNRKPLLLENGKELRFGFKNDINLHYIFITLNNIKNKILINKISKFYLKFKNNDIIIIEIELKEGRKIITLHSGKFNY
jgi:hypothetical protein